MNPKEAGWSESLGEDTQKKPASGGQGEAQEPAAKELVAWSSTHTEQARWVRVLNEQTWVYPRRMQELARERDLTQLQHCEAASSRITRPPGAGSVVGQELGVDGGTELHPGPGIQALLETKGPVGSREGTARKRLVPPWGADLVPPPEPQGAPAVSTPVDFSTNGWAIVKKNARKSSTSLL